MALENVITTLVLDVIDHDQTQGVVKAIALDSKTRYVQATIVQHGLDYDVDPNAVVTLTILRPDNVGVQITGSVVDVDNSDRTGTIKGVFAELTQAALAKSGTLRAQFKMTVGQQILRTEIFRINNGIALDGETSEWADKYQGYNLDELVQSVNDVVTTVTGMESDVSDLKEGLSAVQNGYSYLLGYGDFVRGTLYNGALRTNITYRVTTTNILQFDYDITLDVSNTFKFGAHLFVDGTFSQDTGWHTTAYKIPAGTQFKPVIARRTENTSEVADILTFVKQVTFKNAAQQTIAEADKHLASHFYLPIFTISEELLKQGNLGDNGEDSTYAQNAGAISDFLFAVNDVAIYADTDNYPNARAYVHYFDESRTWIKGSGWQAKYVIPKGSIFRILLRQVYNSTSAVSVSNIYSSFSIYSAVSNKCCHAVSHQGNVNTTDNSCKLDGYIRAGMAGFEFAECDVKFTSDDVPVCSHDGVFTDATTGTSIRIESYTLAQLKGFDFHGGTIATLDEVVSVCKKYGMELLIDQYNADWTAARYDAIFAVLNKYRYAKHCRHIIYDSACASPILSRDKTAWLICGQSYSSTSPDSAIALADAVVTDYNRVDVMFYYGLGADVISAALASVDSRYGVNIYILDTIALKAEFAPMATLITTNTDPQVYFE